MGYGGESNAKRQARCAFWMDALENDNFRQHHVPNLGRFLVLCGPDRGDVKYLDARLSKLKYKSKLEPDEMIIAVDEQLDTLSTALGRGDDDDRPTRVVYKHAKALDIAKEYRHEFSAIYLDLCNNATPEVLEEAASTAAVGLRDYGVFALSIMCGREKDGLFEEIQKASEASSTRFKMFDRYAGRMITGEHRVGGMSASAFMRTQYVWDQMTKNLDKFCRGVLIPKGMISYSSRRIREDRSAGGVPMLVLWWVFRRSHKPLNRKQHEAWSDKLLLKEFDTGGTRLLVSHFEPDVDGSNLREFASALRAEGHDTDTIGRILNLPPRKLAAWFAWDTMNKRKAAEK